MFGQEGFYCFVGSLVLGSSKTAVLSSWDCNQFPVDARLLQRFLEANRGLHGTVGSASP